MSSQLGESIGQLRSVLVEEETLQSTLGRIAELAVRAIERCCAAGVAVGDGERTTTTTATARLVRDIDAEQYAAGEGPCLDALRSGNVVHAPRLEEEQRWPRYRRVASEEGVESVLCIPLSVGGSVIGALNLYGSVGDSFGTEDVRTARLFGAQAAVALDNARRYADARSSLAEVEQRAAEASAVERAVGILIVRDGLDAEDARAALERRAGDEQAPLRDVAEALSRETARADPPGV